MSRPLLLLLAALQWITCVHAQAPAAAEPRVHAVLVFDTNGVGIGACVQRDRWNVLRSIHGGFRDAGHEKRLVKTVLDGQYAHPQNVVTVIRNLRPAPDDVVLVYYAGHGAFDPSRGHFLNMRAGKLFRSTIQAEMKKHEVRLSVLITESCSTVEPTRSFHKSLKPGGPPTGNWETLSKLFFETSGTVDVNSSKPSQTAAASSDTGAFFTHSLADVLCRPPAADLTWQTAIRQAERGVWRTIPPNEQSVHVHAMRERGQMVVRGKRPDEPAQVVTRRTLPPAQPVLTRPEVAGLDRGPR